MPLSEIENIIVSLYRLETNLFPIEADESALIEAFNDSIRTSQLLDLLA